MTFADAAAPNTPIYAAPARLWADVAATLEPATAAFAQAAGFKGAAGRVMFAPAEKGAVVLAGIAEDAPFGVGALATQLPAGAYRFASPLDDPEAAAMGWLLSSYRFERYRAVAAAPAMLVAPEGVDAARIARVAAAITMGRDLINTPAFDLGPDALQDAAAALAKAHKARMRVTRGKDLKKNFPLVHAVGAAGHEEPRLIDIRWGDKAAPKLTLVGKGVTFDTGGLDIKPPSGMLIMKKDMGGAATALALARMVMEEGLNVRLRVILPIVENAIASVAFRPGDVLPSRNGLTVEIGNTDAEGRLILADALTLACEDAPDLLLDFATLTGAARVALGPDLPPFYTHDDALAADIATHGARTHDPVWRMPLWQPYASQLDSRIAHLNNAPGGGMAGSITAALFLDRFVPRAVRWAHFDVYAWNPKTLPARPEGGDIQTARLLLSLLTARYAA